MEIKIIIDDEGVKSSVHNEQKRYVIKDIRKGTRYQEKWLYATLEDMEGKTCCSSLLGFILNQYYKKRDYIANYEEALNIYVKHYEG